MLPNGEKRHAKCLTDEQIEICMEAKDNIAYLASILIESKKINQITEILCKRLIVACKNQKTIECWREVKPIYELLLEIFKDREFINNAHASIENRLFEMHKIATTIYRETQTQK